MILPVSNHTGSFSRTIGVISYRLLCTDIKSHGTNGEGQMSSPECCLAKFHEVGDVSLIGESTLFVKPKRVHEVVQRHDGLQIVPVPGQAIKSMQDIPMPFTWLTSVIGLARHSEAFEASLEKAVEDVMIVPDRVHVNLPLLRFNPAPFCMA